MASSETPIPPPNPNNSTDPNGVKKRKRGATRLSCAECRRLKLRCDRSIPCGSCVKRGCAAICPDGSLTTGKGNRSNRFVLASTQDLHEKIQELSNRVRELEDALRTSHGTQSNDLHPLLTEELLRIKAPLQREGLASQMANGDGDANGTNPDIVDSFGSLAISDTGRTSFFGQATNSFYYLKNEKSEVLPEQDREDRMGALRNLLPPEILSMAGFFPIAPIVPLPPEAEQERSERLSTLYWYLPPADEAAQLRDIYFQHAAWMYSPISISQFNDHAYLPFYNPTGVPNLEGSLHSHQLALLFIVLAIGSLMDIKRPAYNIEAEKFHQLSRAALFQSPIFEEPTLHAVQTLYLMAFYLFLSERHGSGVGSRWGLMGLAVKLGISMGLHRDAGRWKVDFSEIQRRREAFWELYSYDLLQSFTLGRPQSLSPTHIDCKKPHSDDPNNDDTFHWWKHRFTSECMSSVYDSAFGAKTPTYTTVLQLDRKLRAFPVPPLLQIAGFGNTEPRPPSSDSIPLILQRHVVLAIRESHLLYMHRGFFARAISDHPRDPLGSPYGTSFIAAYRSAGSLVALVRNIHSQLKELTERMWFLWTHLFSCSIILGSIVTRCPTMSLASSALLQLESACDLFDKTARLFHAENVLAIMLNLREKARASFHGSRNSPSRQNSLSEPNTPADEHDELNILGGRTRLVPSKDKSSSPQVADRSPTTMNPIVPLPLGYDNNPQVHQSVLDYLRTFGPSHGHPQEQHFMQSQPTPQAGPSQQPMMIPSTPFDLSQQQIHSASTSPVSGTFGSMPFQSPGGMPSMGQVDMSQQHLLPQYFPVFDYGNVSLLDSFPGLPQDNGDMANRAYSPETNMHSAWQDFITQMNFNP